MEPTPGDKTSEWRATLLALLALPGFGAAMAIFKEALLARPWPFVALAGIGAAVAAVYVVCRTWLKGRGVATVAALLVLALALPARAGDPEVTARAPLPADVAAVVQPAVPSMTVDDNAKAVAAAAVIAGFKAGFETAKQGVEILPKSWMDTRAGQVLVGVICGGIIITTAAGAGVGAYMAAGK